MVDKIPLVCPRCGGEKKTKNGIYCHSCGVTIACKKRSRLQEHIRCKIHNKMNRQYYKKHVSVAEVWRKNNETSR
jgi:PHP family Zn ribbon phosphoesterase